MGVEGREGQKPQLSLEARKARGHMLLTEALPQRVRLPTDRISRPELSTRLVGCQAALGPSPVRELCRVLGAQDSPKAHSKERDGTKDTGRAGWFFLFITFFFFVFFNMKIT